MPTSLGSAVPSEAVRADVSESSGQAKLLRRELPPEGAPVHVRVRLDEDRELPDLLLWDDRLWAVRQVLHHAIEQPGPPGSLGEHVWWVIATAGRSGAEHVCILGQSYPGGRWRLRSVLGELSAACG